MALIKKKFAKRIWRDVDRVPTPMGVLFDNAGADWQQLSGSNASFNDTWTFSGPSFINEFQQGRIENVTYGLNGLDSWKMTVEFKVLDQSTANGTSVFEIGCIGKSTYNSYRTSVRFSYANTNSSYGKVQTNIGTITSSSAISFSNGDNLKLVLDYSAERLIGTIYNVTTGLSVSAEQTFLWVTSGDSSVHNRGYFSIANAGGSVEVLSAKVESTEYKYADLIIIGDSKTKGLYADGYTNRYANLVGAGMGKVVVNHSGRSDETKITLDGIQQILDLAPQNALLHIGSNDVRMGRSYADYTGYYNDIVNALEAAGIKVWHCTSAPDLVNVGLLAAYIESNYSGKIVDLYDSILNDGTNNLSDTYDGGDGVHPNQAGNIVMADLIIDFLSGKI